MIVRLIGTTMGVVVLDSALKHGFSAEDIERAWSTIAQENAVRIRHEKYPPHYMGIGLLPSGRAIEMIAFSDGIDWYVFHACSPLTARFKMEYRDNGGAI